MILSMDRKRLFINFKFIEENIELSVTDEHIQQENPSNKTSPGSTQAGQDQGNDGSSCCFFFCDMDVQATQ